MANESASQAALDDMLDKVDRLRSSVPALLKTFTLSSLSPVDRSELYRDRSTNAWNSLKQLRESLSDHSLLLEQLEQAVTERKVVENVPEAQLLALYPPKHREDEHSKSIDDPLDDLNRIFSSNVGQGSLLEPSRGLVQYDPRFPDTKTSQDVVKLVDDWRTLHPNTVSELEYKGEMITMTIKGLMRAFMALGRSNNVVMVERVACFGLHEKRAMYMRSEYALFQQITQKAMNVVDKSYHRSPKRSNVEHLLAFLTQPPVPF